MTRAPCGSLWGLIWAVSPCLMRRRSVRFGICYRRTKWGNSSLPGLGSISPRRSEAEWTWNRTKSKVRERVEHAFLVIKRIFGWAKVRYRGLAKKTHWLQISCGLANLYVARRRLLAGT